MSVKLELLFYLQQSSVLGSFVFGSKSAAYS